MEHESDSRRLLLCLLVVIVVTTVVGTVVLGALGILQTTERGDIEYIDSEHLQDGTIVTADGQYQFVVESPTDADAFYNAVVRVLNGGPAINPDSTEGIQTFHYHPITYFVFLPMGLLGYVPFKFALLGVSIVSVAFGAALVLRAEANHLDIAVDVKWLLGAAVVVSGFGPVLSNYKAGQTTAFIFLTTCLGWWAYRSEKLVSTGVALSAGALFKPYVVAPVALGFARRKWRVVAGVGGTYIGATLVALAHFGASDIATYFQVIIAKIFTEVERGESIETMAWTASRLRLFEWLGPLALVVRALVFVPLVYLGLVYLLDDTDRYAHSLYAATLVSIFVLVTEVEAVDLILLIPAYLVVGLHVYAKQERFWPVFAGLLLLHIHPMVLEILVGNGPRFVPTLARHQDLLQLVVPVLQPGIYAFAILYWLVFVTAPPLPDPRRLISTTRSAPSNKS